MVHEDTLWVCLTYSELTQQTEKRWAFIFWAKVVQYWNLCPQLDHTFSSIGSQHLQLYQNYSTCKVHEKGQ